MGVWPFHRQCANTDQGIYGQGEATGAAAGAVPLVQDFRQFLVGQDPLNVDQLFERLRTSGIFAGAQGGQYVTALSGVEIALWDLAGKALGLPIYQLLGGKMRDRIRMYCDLGTRKAGDSPSPEMIQQVKGLGFTAVKTDLDDLKNPQRWDRVNGTAGNAEIDEMVRKIADMAHTYYVPLAPHCVVSPIGTMASCHICAAIPNFLVPEWHWLLHQQLWRSFVKEGEIIDRGFINITDRPGIGLEMNDQAARSAQVPGTPWFEAV